MSTAEAISKMLGAGLTAGSRMGLSIKELERRAEADANRLKVSMDTLEMGKKRLELQEKAMENRMLRDALDAELKMVMYDRQVEDEKALREILHGYEKELIDLRNQGKTGKAPPAKKPYGLETSSINSLLGHGKSEAKFGADFGGALNQGLNAMIKSGLVSEPGWIPGAKNLPATGETKPFHASQLRPVKKKNPPNNDTWDAKKLSDEELRKWAK
jgi:hypothetical protein